LAYRIKCTVAYDGTNYFGWQRQKNQPTVQDKIEYSLAKLHNEDIQIHGASRTDSLVHANNQVFHFDSTLDLTESKWKIAINNFLPKDIYIKKVEKVSNEFHARYSVKKKRYIYKMSINDYDPLKRHNVSFVRRKLDISLMKQEITKLIGTHNFKSFTGGTIYENYVRELYEADLMYDEGDLIFTFVGKGFLRYMIRTIVGTLVEIGYGRKEDILKILNDQNRDSAGKSAEPQGLYLDKIWY